MIVAMPNGTVFGRLTVVKAGVRAPDGGKDIAAMTLDELVQLRDGLKEV